jgi:predicted Ser/Thr protein kinase
VATLPTAIGRYKVIRSLGEGGMGSVYLALDPVIDRLVAIKQLKEDLDNDDLRERFAREARSAGRLRHANIPIIFDVGEDRGHPFIAMEYIEGRTLAELIKTRAEVPLPQKLYWMEQLAGGLAYAHLLGIVHRDIKPANLMVDRLGTLKILDFGIARLGGSGMTQAGMLMGTLNYMSPEQVSGVGVDHLADVFAVGAVFYEILSYRRAFPGDLQDGILHRLLYKDPDPPIEEACPGLDPEIAQIVSRALQKDPARRHQDLEEMRTEVGLVRERLDPTHSSGSFPIAVGPDAPAGATGGTPLPSSPRDMRTPRRGPDREQAARLRLQQIEGHLATARRALDTLQYEVVFDACQKALILDPDNSQALHLADRARAFFDEKPPSSPAVFVPEQAARRATPPGLSVQQAIDRAKEAFRHGSFAEAVESAERALAIDPASTEAKRLREQARDILETRRQIEEEDRARQVASQARRQFDEGDQSGALRLLETHQPRHEVIDTALRDLRARKAAEDRRRLEDAQVREVVDEARRQFADGHESDALRLLEAHQPRHEVIEHALIELRAKKAAAERRRQEELRARKTAEDARALFAAGEEAAALTQLEAYQPEHEIIEGTLAELRARKAAADRRREQERRARQVVDEARRRFAAGDEAGALALLEAHHPPGELVEEALAELRTEHAAAELRREERRARDHVEAARRRFDDGDPTAAIGLLESYAPGNRLVDTALTELRAAADRLQQTARLRAGQDVDRSTKLLDIVPGMAGTVPASDMPTRMVPADLDQTRVMPPLAPRPESVEAELTRPATPALPVTPIATPAPTRPEVVRPPMPVPSAIPPPLAPPEVAPPPPRSMTESVGAELASFDVAQEAPSESRGARPAAPFARPERHAAPAPKRLWIYLTAAAAALVFVVAGVVFGVRILRNVQKTGTSEQESAGAPVPDLKLDGTSAYIKFQITDADGKQVFQDACQGLPCAVPNPPAGNYTLTVVFDGCRKPATVIPFTVPSGATILAKSPCSAAIVEKHTKELEDAASRDRK